MRATVILLVAIAGGRTWAADAGAPSLEERADARARQMCAYEVDLARRAADQHLPSATTYQQGADRCIGQQLPIARQQIEGEDEANRKRAERSAEKVRRDDEERANEIAARQAYEKNVSSPGFTRQRLSALLCYASAEKRHAKDRIDEQRRGARAGMGIVDKEKVYESQQEIVAMEELEKAVRRDLKSAHAAAMDCRKLARTELEAFVSCVDSQRSDAVDDSAAESVESIEQASLPCAAERSF